MSDMSMVERKEFVQETLALGVAGIALGLTTAMPAWAQGQAEDMHVAGGAPDSSADQAEEDAQVDPATDSDEAAPAAQLPPAEPDPESDFGVDLNVNMDTIDDYLGIPGVAYRDMRLLKDPADYSAIGGDSVLSFAIEGFKVVPYPYVGTLQELPVSGAYEGERLFDVEWDEAGEIVSATPCYEQSLLVLQDLFPRDAPVVLCCGGGGYAAMMKKLLVYLGWDESLLYTAGGVWDYTGYEAIELAHVDEAGETQYFFWRADVAPLDFSLLTPASEK